jgi:tight adherence protein C
MALRLNPKLTVETISTRLMASGLSSRFTATQFLAAKGAFGILGVVAAILLGIVNAPLFGILFAPALGGVGFFAPDSILTMRTRARRERIRSEVPDALDLLAVSVEAGLGFDGAITKLTEFMEGPLVEEFALTLGEVRIGESRHDALKKLAERVPAPEVASFVRSVVQADQLGISLGRILRVQAADSRLRRQALAEEKAMKAPIKMLFPTVFFIFPAMFIVILGSAFLNLANYL